MSLKTFFKYVEIQTKLASLFPFIFGVIYSYYIYGEINVLNTVLMYISLLSLDMGVTAINNYMDYKKARLDEYKYNTNIIGRESISNRLAVSIILLLLFICVSIGLILVVNTSVIVLILGAVAFFIGVFYTYGPMPISRTPLGEVVSGLTMGFLIVFITVYIQNTEIIKLVIRGVEGTLLSDSTTIIINISLIQCIKIFLVSLPFVFVISNLMFANNMRDVEVDIKNDRLTLPYYIGRKNSLSLFKVIYNMCYVVFIILMLIKIVPTLAGVITLISYSKVNSNIEKFEEELNDNKESCFKYAVFNMMIISKYYIFGFLVYFVVQFIV